MPEKTNKSRVCYGIGPYRTAAGLVLFFASVWLGFLILEADKVPSSTPIKIVDEDNLMPADPSDLPLQDDRSEGRYTLGFVGDIMHHQGQVKDDFFACYQMAKPILAECDLAIGNLEFPVDPSKPAGPGFLSARFNGSTIHLDALADAGFDVLSTANNHSFDQGLSGATTTLYLLAERNLIGIGTTSDGSSPEPKIVEVGDIRLAMVGYTIPPNSYPDANGEVAYWPRDWPIHALNFNDWTEEYRREGLQLFERHQRAARESGAEFVVALVHWGREWHLRPSKDQRRAARDMIDAGFDLVVGSHAHVLNPPEIYRGRLVAYSLGNFISDFVPWQTRVGTILKIAIARTSHGVKVVDFQFVPTWTRRAGHVIVPLRSNETAKDRREAWSFAKRILGPGVVTPLNH